VALTKADPEPGRTRLVAHSGAFLPQGYAVARQPRFGWRARPAEFSDNFETRALFYDVFRHADGEQVLLVGPPPRNLLRLLKRAHFSVKGVKGRLKPRFFISQSVMIIALGGVPRGADILHMRVDDLEFALPIRKNFSDELAGRRVLFTISRDNPLPWIRAWAHYHERFQGVDAVILLDNGSANATLDEIARELEKTSVEKIYLLSLPYIFGAIDNAVLFNPFWTNFLQLAFNSLVLRRFGALAEGLLNCDIDEFAFHLGAPTVFEALKQTPQGLLAMNGSWIEAQPLSSQYGDHRDFGYRAKDLKERVCSERKWLLDPKRDWVQNLRVHPYWHWINGRPARAKTMSGDAFFWHFKGVNTNWKVERNKVPAGPAQLLEPDPELRKVFSRWFDES